MEDLQRYLTEFIEPTIADFEQRPTSVRHAFLACLVTFHGVDYLAYPKDSGNMRGRFRKESPDFAIVEEIALAFKHVITGPRGSPTLKAQEVISRPPAFWGTMYWDLSRWDDAVGGVTLDRNREIDLLEVLKRAATFLRQQISGSP